jgi:ribosomal protein S12 methylthiotransferase accessory factor YcaO
MSYIYKVPVLMSLIVNKKTHTVTINIGASPVFEIAVERVLTELYQGTYSFNDIKLTG